MRRTLIISVIVGILLVGVSYVAFPQTVTNIVGMSVAQTSAKWNRLKDMAAGDANTNGAGLFTPCLWNGSSCDRQRGTIAGGALVSVAGVGTTSYSIKRDNIAGSSVNLSFGFTSRKISIRVPSTNTDELCIDWLGGTAVCPAANTAGDGRLAAGTTFFIDDYATTSLSFIASSGTQTVYVDAWN